jgi:hypothetical protein
MQPEYHQRALASLAISPNCYTTSTGGGGHQAKAMTSFLRLWPFPLDIAQTTGYALRVYADTAVAQLYLIKLYIS